MNIGSDDLSVRAEEKIEATRQEKTEQEAALVELGKVSDTKGGWVGSKMDSGPGFTAY
jgi:hypothetical protein